MARSRRSGKTPSGTRPQHEATVPRFALPMLLGIAALGRVVLIAQYGAGSPYFDVPYLDALSYDRLARAILGGAWLPSEPFYFAPGYSYVLAAFYALGSEKFLPVYVAQGALGLLNIWLVHWLARRAFGPRAGLCAALLMVLYAPLPFLELKLMPTTVGLSLLLLALVALTLARDHGALWRWALAGLLLGAASLVRPPTLVALPFLLVWGSVWGGHGSRRRAVLALAALLMGWGLAIAPATLHNLRMGSGLTLISSQAGITFFQANNPRASGFYTSLTEYGFSGRPSQQAQEEKAAAERALGRSLSPSEVSAYWFRRGLSFVAENPGEALWLVGMKFLRFVSAYEHATEFNLRVERKTLWVLHFAFVPFTLLLILAIPALFACLAGEHRGDAPGRQSTQWLLIFAVAWTVLTLMIFYVSSRYRLPAVPPLLCLAGASLAALVSGNAKRLLRLPVVALIVVVLGLAALERDETPRFQEASAHRNLGNAWLKKGEAERAVLELRRAATATGTIHQHWYRLGQVLTDLQRHAEAAEAFRAAAALLPEHFETRALLGLNLDRSGDLAGARAAYEWAARLRPTDIEVLVYLARVAARMGDRAAALRHFDRALEIQPGAAALRAERDRL